MYRIVALYPFSPDSIRDANGHSVDRKTGKRVNWHLVLFDRWFDLHTKEINPKWEFSLTNTDGIGAELGFTRHWGNDLVEDDWDGKPYHFQVIKLPWHYEAFKVGYLLGGKWKSTNIKRIIERNSLEGKSDKRKFRFLMRAGDETLTNEVTVHAVRYYDSIYWFPLWLKNLIHWHRTHIELEFSEEIGKGRGSWKGGILGMGAAFHKSIENSWYLFKNGELLNILKRGNQEYMADLS